MDVRVEGFGDTHFALMLHIHMYKEIPVTICLNSSTKCPRRQVDGVPGGLHRMLMVGIRKGGFAVLG